MGAVDILGKKKFKAEDDQKSKQWMKEDFLNSIQNILPSKVGEQKKNWGSDPRLYKMEVGFQS